MGLETIEDSLMKAWGQAGEISEVMEERGEVSPLTTSIVYTDEGGREQSLVGKVFYQTDETGQSTIFIQEVQHEVKKLVKLNLGDTEGYMIAGPGEVKEALEQRLEEELEGNEARLEEEVEFQASEMVGGQGSEIDASEGQHSARTASEGQSVAGWLRGSTVAPWRPDSTLSRRSCCWRRSLSSVDFSLIS